MGIKAFFKEGFENVMEMWFGMNGYEEYTQKEVTTSCQSEKWLRCIAVFVAGAVAGQIIKKIFKD